MLEVTAGACLLMLGLRWLRRAMLSYAGSSATRDSAGNALALALGVTTSAFGIYWFGEGVGVDWPFGDAAILGILLLLQGTGQVGIRLARGMAE